MGIPLVVLGWFGAVYLGTRGLYGTLVRRRERKLGRTFAQIEALLEADPQVKVRVDAEQEDEGRDLAGR